MDDPIFEKTVRSMFDDQTRREQEELQKVIDALTPVLGREDAEAAALLEQDVRLEPKRQLAKLGAEFIKERLNAPSPLRQLMKLEGGVPLLVVSKKEP